MSDPRLRLVPNTISFFGLGDNVAVFEEGEFAGDGIIIARQDSHSEGITIEIAWDELKRKASYLSMQLYSEGERMQPWHSIRLKVRIPGYGSDIRFNFHCTTQMLLTHGNPLVQALGIRLAGRNLDPFPGLWE